MSTGTKCVGDSPSFSHFAADFPCGFCGKTILMKTILILALLGAPASQALAQVPSAISYQGRVQVSGTNFTGGGLFKFAIVSPATNINRTATARATVTSGFVTSVSVTDGGAGYTSAPAVT